MFVKLRGDKQEDNTLRDVMVDPPLVFSWFCSHL